MIIGVWWCSTDISHQQRLDLDELLNSVNKHLQINTDKFNKKINEKLKWCQMMADWFPKWHFDQCILPFLCSTGTDYLHVTWVQSCDWSMYLEMQTGNKCRSLLLPKSCLLPLDSAFICRYHDIYDKVPQMTKSYCLNKYSISNKTEATERARKNSDSPHQQNEDSVAKTERC